MPTPKSTLFAVSKDTKEDAGKSMKNACTAVCQKVPLGLKQCQTENKNQTCSLSHYLYEGIIQFSQSGS